MKYILNLFLLLLVSISGLWAQSKKPVEIWFFQQAEAVTAQGFFLEADSVSVTYLLNNPASNKWAEADKLVYPLGDLEQITLRKVDALGKGRKIGTAVGALIGLGIGLPLMLSNPDPESDQLISGKLIGGLFAGTSTILGFTIGGAIGNSKKFIVLDGADTFLPVEERKLKRLAW